MTDPNRKKIMLGTPCSICGLEIKDDQTVMKTLDDEGKIKEAWHEQCFYGKRAIEAFRDAYSCVCDFKPWFKEKTIEALKNLATQDAGPQEAKPSE